MKILISLALGNVPTVVWTGFDVEVIERMRLMSRLGPHEGVQFTMNRRGAGDGGLE
jgi:hypothetical protein